MKISTVILTKNEEKNLERAIKSALFSDEIVVIDDFSQDNTINIAKKHGVIVYQRKLDGDFASQRNFGLEKSRGDWILFIDADEQVSDGLAQEIKRAVNSDLQNDVYYIKRRDFWWGRELKYGETKKVRDEGLIRLVKKNSGQWKGIVHEVFQTSGHSGKLESFLNHYPHPTLSEFIAKINRYSSLRAKQLYKEGKKSSICQIIFFPLAKFIVNYFINLGFLDGPAGFSYAFLMSFHSFLVRSKLYQYQNLDQNGS